MTMPQLIGMREIKPSKPGGADISSHVAQAAKKLGRKFGGTVKPQDMGHQATVEVYTNGTNHQIRIEGSYHAFHFRTHTSYYGNIKVLAGQETVKALNLPAKLSELGYNTMTA